MNRKRLYLVHAQGRYGENCYVPFSVGCLWAYARTFPEVNEAYQLGHEDHSTNCSATGFLYLKEPIEKAAARLQDPDVVAISHYIWNAEWNKAFAKAVKERWPNCTIIVGGPSVEDESARTLEENWNVFDFAIYGEGEGAFADFLRLYRSDWPACSAIDWSQVGSLIYPAQEWSHWREERLIIANPRREFCDLATLRSPYLDGVFDDLWPREPRWQILVEYDRGCPYRCSMCSWGNASLDDLRLFPEDRIRAELEWFGAHKADYIDQADANYGIVRRDIALTDALVETKTKHGYPKTFRTSFAKNSNEVIWTIANKLHGAGMLKSVTLAMQSMDDNVLVQIQRKNIKFDKFGDLIKRYEEAGIPTYTELIIGLAGESLNTFLDGMERCMEAGQHSGLFCYLNISLPNTEQATAEYVTAHGIETVPMKAMLSHGTPDNSVPREVQHIVVATKAMPHEDWKRAWLHSKVVEVFHAQGLLQEIAISFKARGKSYRSFYKNLLDWCLTHPESVAGREVCALRGLLDRVLAGGLWDCVDERLGDISWPPEEFAFARICLELEKFYDEISAAAGFQIPVEELQHQIDAISPPWADTVAWAREIIWYGRKGAAAKLRKEKRQ